MPFLKRIIPPCALLLLTACASGQSHRPDLSDVVPPRSAKPAVKARVAVTAAGDPDQALRSALDALKSSDGEAALTAARQVIEQFPDTVWYKRALFVTEEALILQARSSEAEAAMLRVREAYPEVADYALFLLADHHAAGGRFSQAAALYQQVTDHYPNSFLVPESSFRTGLALLNSYAYGPAVDVLEKFFQDNPRSEFAPAAGLGLARAYTAEARLADAVRAYRTVWVRYPDRFTDREIEQGLADLKGGGAEIPELTIDDLYERGVNLFRSSQYDMALDVFTKVLQKNPSPQIRPEVMLRAGVACFFLGKRGDAAVILEKMVRDYPVDQRTPEALYWAGKSYSKLADWERGTSTFQKLLDRFPESDWADDALFLTGNIYRETGDMEKALKSYGRLVREYPDSKYADSALWWKAWSFYTAGEYAKAEQGLQELINRYPRSFLVAQARYWQGRSAEKRGAAGRAVSYYSRVRKKSPYTYYGYRASERLARIESKDAVAPVEIDAEVVSTCTETPCPEDPLASFETDIGPPVWTDETRQVLSAVPSFAKTLELMHLDMKKEAARELWALQDRLPKKRGMLIGLSKAFFELGDYYRSLQLVLRNYERYLEGSASGASGDLWLLAYPQGYWDSILLYSRKYGQDPYFIAAIIREESQFSASAQSPAGARGLMQVMPATGEWAAQLIKLAGFDRGKLYDSETGINIGTWYISHLMKRFKGDPLLVAAAYNAGPDAVSLWIEKYGYGSERDVFVEGIPFAETRGYVKKVLRNYAEYKRIYGGAGDLQPFPQRPGAASTTGNSDRQAKNP